MLTENEKKVLRLLMAAFDTDYSINQVARECNITPNGAYKILKKFEREGILAAKNIANIKSYRVNFNNEATDNYLELALMNDLAGRIKYRMDDLKHLRNVTKVCIIFGSYISQKKEPNDLDVLFIVEKENYKEYKAALREAIIPVKIHDVVQTENDLLQNIRKKEKVIMEILRKGHVLWGQKTIVKVIHNAGEIK